MSPNGNIHIGQKCSITRSEMHAYSEMKTPKSEINHQKKKANE